jgi:hypothetical protein
MESRDLLLGLEFTTTTKQQLFLPFSWNAWNMVSRGKYGVIMVSRMLMLLDGWIDFVA